jgi:hypothetical protein
MITEITIAGGSAILLGAIVWSVGRAPKVSVGEPDRAVLQEPPFTPPMIDGMSLRDYLIHSWKVPSLDGRGVWDRVVDDFYVLASSKPNVARYFDGYNIGEIKQKFLRTLLVVAHAGISKQAARNLARKHSHLAIAGPDFDDVVGALVIVLRKYNVPQYGIDQLNPMMRYMRAVMVTGRHHAES